MKTHFFYLLILLIGSNVYSQECDPDSREAQRVQIFQPQLKKELLYIVQLYTYRKKFLWSAHYNSTAAFIHPRVLITAGHNLYNRKTNVVDITLKVGATHKDSFLVKQEMKTKMYKNIYVLPSYNNHQTTKEDIGIIILPDSTLYKKAQGHFQIAAYSSSIQGPLQLTGYPGPNGGIKLWNDQTTNFNVADGILNYDFYTEKGASGSPIYTKNNHLVAVHTTGGTTEKSCNHATIITPKLLTSINEWCLQHNIRLGE